MFMCNRLFFYVTSLLCVLLQFCFDDSSMHCYINYLAKNISRFFAYNFFQSLKCYCDENFVFSFPVFLSVISYLDPKFHESAKFFTI